MDTDLEQAKTVFVGDPSRRVSLAMPVSLNKLLARVRKIYSVSEVQLWHDANAMGHAPGQGRRLIRDEADYTAIVDGDVVVFTSGGRDLDPCKFDATTTYRADYIEKALTPMRPLSDPVRRTKIYMPPYYSTTYRRDYTAVEPPARTIPDYHEPTYEKAPFKGQTTYSTDYVLHPMAQPSDDPTPISYMDALQVVPHETSVYRRDYIRHPIGQQERAKPCGHVPPSCGATWRPTEYTANYKGMQAPKTEHPDYLYTPRMQLDPPPFCRTTYQRDYVPLDHSVAQSTIHVEPSARERDDLPLALRVV